MEARYFILQESRRGSFGLPGTYDGQAPGRSWHTQRCLARHQWHHMVNQYVRLCGSPQGGGGGAVHVEIPTTICNGRRQPVPYIAAAGGTPDSSSCIRARMYDPLFTGSPIKHAIMQWYTRSVLPVTLGHLQRPPSLVDRRRRLRGGSKMQRSRPVKHHVVRKRRTRTHTVLRRQAHHKRPRRMFGRVSYPE